ncbi:zinc-dependent peptidase [Algoriphagus machipongonensis]|nr:zinc-dependent peptidase [Algoriphagus machipongonensis]
MRRRLKQSDLDILESRFPYFARLSNKHKREFCRKLEEILTIKTFIGRGGVQAVSQEMEVLIGATIVMVTFGWQRVRLPHFKKILIYPNAYYSTISKTYHKGEVNPRHGIIVVSWEAFLEGLENQKDGLNLGIHEIAHALKLENQIRNNSESDFFNPQAYRDFHSFCASEIRKISSDIPGFFRKEGALNEHEFFAVALENFFERPHQFFQYNSKLYGTLVQLLRQDPRVWIKEIA